MAELRLPPSIRDDRGIALEPQIARLADLEPGVVFVQDPATVEASALTALAYGWDMLGPLWERQADAGSRRAYLGEMAALQGLRGTPWALKRALEILGWPGCTLVEGRNGIKYNGLAQYDGYWTYGEALAQWYEYRIHIPLEGAVFTAGNLALIQQIIPVYAPVRDRMEMLVLEVEEHGFGDFVALPSGAEAMLFGVSADGVTWYTRRMRRATSAIVPGGTRWTFEWRAFGGFDAPAGLVVSHFALLNPDLSVFQDWVRTEPITLGTDIEIQGSFTLRVLGGAP